MKKTLLTIIAILTGALILSVNMGLQIIQTNLYFSLTFLS